MACNLYKIPSVLTPTTIIYIDCDGVTQSFAVPGGSDYYFCSTGLITVPVETEEISICICSCQSINVSTIELDITYVDCNDNIVSESIPSSIENPLYVFCSKYLIFSSSPEPVNPVSDKDCLSGTCNSNTSCYTFTPTGETGIIKYYAVNGDLIDTNVSLPINFCGRGIFATSNGVLVNNNTPCTSNYDCNDCYCYSIYNRGEEFTFSYTNCGGVTTGQVIPLGITSFCSVSIITQVDITPLSNLSVLFTGDTCSSGSCVCNCYSLTNNTGSMVQPNYIDCNGLLQTIILEDGETQKVCSIGLSYSNTENIYIIN